MHQQKQRESMLEAVSLLVDHARKMLTHAKQNHDNVMNKKQDISNTLNEIQSTCETVVRLQKVLLQYSRDYSEILLSLNIYESSPTEIALIYSKLGESMVPSWMTKAENTAQEPQSLFDYVDANAVSVLQHDANESMRFMNEVAHTNEISFSELQFRLRRLLSMVQSIFPVEQPDYQSHEHTIFQSGDLNESTKAIEEARTTTNGSSSSLEVTTKKEYSSDDGTHSVDDSIWNSPSHTNKSIKREEENKPKLSNEGKVTLSTEISETDTPPESNQTPTTLDHSQTISTSTDDVKLKIQVASSSKNSNDELNPNLSEDNATTLRENKLGISNELDTKRDVANHPMSNTVPALEDQGKIQTKDPKVAIHKLTKEVSSTEIVENNFNKFSQTINSIQSVLMPKWMAKSNDILSAMEEEVNRILQISNTLLKVNNDKPNQEDVILLDQLISTEKTDEQSDAFEIACKVSIPTRLRTATSLLQQFHDKSKKIQNAQLAAKSNLLPLSGQLNQLSTVRSQELERNHKLFNEKFEMFKSRHSEISDLVKFYNNFMHANANLEAEIMRRWESLAKIEALARSQQEIINQMYEEECNKRDSFHELHGQFLPPTLCPAISKNPSPTTFHYYPVNPEDAQLLFESVRQKQVEEGVSASQFELPPPMTNMNSEPASEL